uniref:Thiamine pyrophosphate enzyme central domain-containing protein n=1 Tax=Oryza glumipatula TaxID=40148 RepID=A0A0E0AEQ2_9ORYZ
MLGMHGTVYANYAVDNTDLLLAFGVHFDDRTNRQNRGIREEGKLTTAGGGDGGERRRRPLLPAHSLY